MTQTDPIETDEAVALRDAVRSTAGPAVGTGSGAGRDGRHRSGTTTSCGRRCASRSASPHFAIPEQYGGAGARLAEVCVVLEELGRALAPAPMLGSAVLCGEAVLATRNEEACARLLPGIAPGTTLAALAWSTEDGDWSPEKPDRVAETGSSTAARITYWTATSPTCSWRWPEPRTGQDCSKWTRLDARPRAGHEHGPDPAAGGGRVRVDTGPAARQRRLRPGVAAPSRHRDRRTGRRAGRARPRGRWN